MRQSGQLLYISLYVFYEFFFESVPLNELE